MDRKCMELELKGGGKSTEQKWGTYSNFSMLLTSCQASPFMSLALIMNSVKWKISTT